MLKWFFYILSTSHIYDRSCWSDSHCHVESCRGDHFDQNPDCGDFRNGLLEHVYDKLEITKWSNVAVSNRLDSKVSLSQNCSCPFQLARDHVLFFNVYEKY